MLACRWSWRWRSSTGDSGEYEATDRLLGLLAEHRVPSETLSSVRFRKERSGDRSRPGEPLPAWRAEFDEAVAARLAAYDFDLAVMFGYLLIATEALHERFRIINDHPALPDGRPPAPIERSSPS